MQLVETNDRYWRIKYLIGDRRKEDERSRVQVTEGEEDEEKMTVRGISWEEGR
jgi:hypothetical protein